MDWSKVKQIVIAVIYIVCGVFIIVLLWNLFQYIKKTFFPEDGDPGFWDPSGKEEEVDFNVHLAAKSSMTFEQVHSVADELELAMASEGTSEDTVVRLLRTLNAADFEALYGAFGRRRYVDGVFGGGNPKVGQFDGTPEALNYWLQKEFEKVENWLVVERNWVDMLKYLPEVFEGSTPYPGEVQLLAADKFLRQKYPTIFSSLSTSEQ